MARLALSRRLAIQIEISQAADRESGAMTADLITRARSLGLTGAEIEAAQQGRSFDVRDAAALALARACRNGSPAEIALRRRKAVAAGLSKTGIQAIEVLAAGRLGRCRTR